MPFAVEHLSKGKARKSEDSGKGLVMGKDSCLGGRNGATRDWEEVARGKAA